MFGQEYKERFDLLTVSSTVNAPITRLEELAENSLLQKEGIANSPVCGGKLRRLSLSAAKHMLVTFRPFRIMYPSTSGPALQAGQTGGRVTEDHRREGPRRSPAWVEAETGLLQIGRRNFDAVLVGGVNASCGQVMWMEYFLPVIHSHLTSGGQNTGC